MDEKQFKNLNLLTVRFPFTAIVSFLHRVSGIIVFLMLPFLLWLFTLALHSATDFAHIQSILITPVAKFILWASVAALWYHLLAGVRHMIMDIGYAESLFWARVTGAATIIITLIITFFIGMWLW